MMEKDPIKFENSLAGKTVVVAATASISIYRLPDIIRDLRREGASVIVGMSREATELISPEVLKWASENEVITKITGEIEHISRFIGQPENTLMLACPASYNFIGKAASGISDDVPSLFFSFALGNGNPVVISPVMHEGMMVNPINASNLKKLEDAGVSIIPPRIEEQKAKISENEKILDYVSRAFSGHFLKNMSVLVIGGKGEEKIDPVRNITNSGTGLTASWLLRNSFRLGAKKITFVGNSQYVIPDYVDYHPAKFMEEYEGVVAGILKKERFDVVINVASLSDFELKEKFREKLDSSAEVALHLSPRKKLNHRIREHHKGFLVVFKLSKETGIQQIRDGFSDVNPDLIIFNPYTEKSVPFGTTRNAYTAIFRESEERLGVLAKPEMTMQIMKIISSRMK